jgi:hypothetical protein
MHKPIMEETNMTILKPESQDVRAYRNLFGEFQGIEFRKNYKTVKPTQLNLTLIGTIFKEKGALAIIKNGNSKSKAYQKGDNIASSVLLKDIAKNYSHTQLPFQTTQWLYRCPFQHLHQSCKPPQSYDVQNRAPDQPL